MDEILMDKKFKLTRKLYPSIKGLGIVPSGSDDPIGDALRADCVAYWKLEESGLSSRVDSSGNGNHLELDWTDPVLNDTGIIGNAAKFVDNTSSASALQNLSISANFSQGVGLACWVKFNQFVPENDQDFYVAQVRQGAGSNTAIAIKVGIAVPGNSDILVHNDLQSSFLTINTWHFVAYWRDASNGKFLKINDVATQSGVGDPYDLPDQIRYVGGGSYVNNADTLLVDEMFLINRPFTENELVYLYNSGLGITLYP